MARILTLTNWYPPHHFGGYEVLCADVMTRLGQRGHDIEVLCSNQLLPDVTDETSPFPVHRELAMYWRDGAPWTPTFSEQLAMERSNQQTLAAALDRFNPDVISVWAMGALSLSLLSTLSRRQIPLVYAICDEWLIYGVALDPWSRRWQNNPVTRGMGRLMERRLGVPTVPIDLGATGFFCFLSDFTRRASRTASPWNFPHQTVVYPGIDRSLFPPSHQADAWNGKLLYTGRLDQRKGTDTVLRALAQLPETTVSFLGRGEATEQARLERLAAELGVTSRIHFEAIPRTALPHAYATHDCLLFPSEWPEPFGLVPLEAMATGTPVVATGTGGSGEYLRDGQNCLLFPPGDDGVLARVIMRLANDTELRRSLRQHGRQTAEHFDIASTVDAYEKCHLAAAQGRVAQADSTSADDVQLTAQVTSEIPHAVLTIGPGQPIEAPGGAVVIEDLAQLPFPDGEFAEVHMSDGIGGLLDDPAHIREIRRVSKMGGTLTADLPNRYDVGRLKAQAGDRWRGRSSPSPKGSTWSEVDALLAPSFRIETRGPIGWTATAAGRACTRVLIGPLRSLSKGIRITARAQ